MNYLVWQLVDSAFPSGGFAHSSGLEAAVQHGHIGDAAAVGDFARRILAQAGHGSLPLVRAAHRTPTDLPQLDRLSEAFLTNPVANRASRAQGRALVTSVSRSIPGDKVAEIEKTVRDEALAAHVAPIFGAVMNAVGIDEMDAQRMFLFIAVRSVASAGVRLGLIGAFDAQRLQAELAPELGAVIERYRNLEPDEIAQTAPLVDLFQSTHDRLYSRLFQS